MKKISILLLTLFLLASCAQDFIETSPQPTGDEVTAHFSFHISPMHDNSPSKATSTKAVDPLTVDESQISDMWIVQYDKTTGNFIKKVYSQSVNVAAFDAPLAPSVTGASNIYFLANIGPSLITSYTEAQFLKQIKNVTTEAGMLINGKQVAGVSKFNIPMYGSLLNVTVPSTATLDPLTVDLTRALARVDITYTVPSTLANDFYLEGVRLCNVPIGIQFAPAGTAGATATSVVPVSNYDVTSLTAITGTNTLTFYIPENQKGIGTNTALSNQRLKTGVTDATYIEFVGHTKGTQGGEEVGYSIYPGKDIYNDYNLTRNVKYATAITLSDVSFSDLRVKLHGANCYVVHPGSSVNISVMPANKSDLGIQLPDVTTGWTSAVYWQSAASLVTTSDATASRGYFKVSAPDAAKEGNALVCIKDGSGNVLWSWHIWVTASDFNNVNNQEVLNGLTWMDRNLGALSRCGVSGATKVGYELCGGFYYQWGRKDPFIGTTVTNTSNPILNATYGPTTAAFVPPTTYSVAGVGTATASSPAAPTNAYFRYADASVAPISYTNQLIFSVRYPLLFLSNWSGSSAKTAIDGSNSWGGEYNQPKSSYDPCPEGWRVPSAKKTSTTLASPWGSVGAYALPAASPSSNGESFYFNNGTGTGTYYAYPSIGYISSDCSFWGVGFSADVLTATLLYSTSDRVSTLYFLYNGVSQTSNTPRCLGHSVRCVKIQ